jgi:superfamily II RNA helicase
MANFIYDAFQKQAIDAIDHGDSVIVSSPTGSGKTAIAEHVINLCIKKGQGVIYTAPIKALSNQKFRDFENLYGDKVGILTGDVSINPFGQLLIMTTEIFRNKALVEPASLAQYHWIIFDEIHYLDDPERGSVWEESIMFLPEQMKILCLSATIPNINELAGWIEYVHKKPLKRIIEDKRPVPLHFFFQCQGEIIAEWKKLKSSYQQAKASYFYRGRRFAKHPNLKPNRLSSLVNYLQKSNKLPVIYFAFGRKRCAELAWELSQANFLEADEQKKAITEFDRLCQRYELTAEKSAQEIAALVEKGIAFHHAGMLPTLKEVVERLFTARLIKVIFTTETFALGINMPARSVCFDALRKFYGVYHRNLKTRDFYQMAGRAGRRGMDKEGFVFLRLNPHLIDLKEVERILYGQPEKVNSQFNSSYATLLHLYK